MKKITQLTVENFTVFKEASFDFASGVNTFIGENGTGKSHVLKLLYALSEALRRFQTKETGLARNPDLRDILAKMLEDVFQPDHLGRLVRRGRQAKTAHIKLGWGSASIAVSLTARDRLEVQVQDIGPLERAIFLPPREVLSIFPGFVTEWDARKSSFDRTYRDLCEALDLRALRGPRGEERGGLLKPIEEALGGSVVLGDNGRFYVILPDGTMEVPLLAEGLRKLAMIDYLLVNGSLTKNGFLFWDEPEANLNPKLARLAGELVFGLARMGVQVLLATHDYALASELSLLSESDHASPSAYFALVRNVRGGVSTERGDQFTDLRKNAILDALGDLHDRELHALSKEPGK